MPDLFLPRLALLCASLTACSPFAWRTDADADALYQQARAHHLGGRPDAARAAYGTVLQADPVHAGARNGLATLHAEDRELAPAIAIWRELTAALTRDAGPGKAYLFANLGHAYLLHGEPGPARAALERACLLDPLNPRGWSLLGEALAALGEPERAGQMQRQAAALRRHDLRADFAVTGGRTAVVPLGQAMGAPAPAPHPDWAQSHIHVGVDGMLELRRLPAIRDAARLEIRNGNGVTGMARALSHRIDEPGVQVTRLSNEPGFAVRHTRIEYEAAYIDAARRLAQRLGSARLQQVEQVAPGELRLVLGRDIAAQGVLRYTRT